MFTVRWYIFRIRNLNFHSKLLCFRITQKCCRFVSLNVSRFSYLVSFVGLVTGAGVCIAYSNTCVQLSPFLFQYQFNVSFASHSHPVLVYCNRIYNSFPYVCLRIVILNAITYKTVNNLDLAQRPFASYACLDGMSGARFIPTLFKFWSVVGVFRLFPTYSEFVNKSAF